MRILLAQQAMKIEIAVVLVLMLTVFAFGVDTSMAWHPLQLVSTDALQTASVDADANGAIDNAEQCTGQNVCEMNLIKITGGSLAAGNVLRSDATGLASWQPGGGVVQGMVISVDAASCPDGWQELTAARGRYLVARPAGGTTGGLVGTPLTNLENRPIGAHTHTLPAIAQHAHKNSQNRQFYYMTNSGNLGISAVKRLLQINPHVVQKASASYVTASSFTGVSISPAGTGDGTNAPYVQRLICVKT